jgi:hypothetical protein
VSSSFLRRIRSEQNLFDKSSLQKTPQNALCQHVMNKSALP